MTDAPSEESDLPRRRNPAVVSGIVGAGASVIAAVIGAVVAFHGTSAPSTTTIAPAYRDASNTSSPGDPAIVTTTASPPGSQSSPVIGGFEPGNPVVIWGTYSVISPGYHIWVVVGNPPTGTTATTAGEPPYSAYGPANAANGHWTESVPASALPAGPHTYTATIFGDQELCPAAASSTSVAGSPAVCSADPLAVLEADGPNAKPSTGTSAPATFVAP